MPDINPTHDILLADLDDNGLLQLTLNTPGSRNALSDNMLGCLGRALAKASKNTSVKVIILAANGPAFCAGHDLKEITTARTHQDRGQAFFEQIMAKCSAVMQALVTCPKPVIAQVNGIATAAGCQLVASCDLAIAADTAQFSTPGVNIGLFCSTPMVALSRNVSHKHAMEMLLTGDMISANKAVDIGLVNQAVPEGALGETTLKLARTIASKSSLTLAIGKRAFYQQSEMTLTKAYTYASNIMVQNMLSRDSEEGIGAFLAKRPPNWQDL